MSDVFRAWDTLLQRFVALKILRPAADGETRERFLREARLACRCRHDHIVITHEAGEFEGRPFLVMEWLEAKSADVLLRENALGGPDRVLSIAQQLAGAIEYIHSLGIIHRDIKPANVCVDDSGRAKLIDFGIARSRDWSCTAPDLAPGTLPYMAPEQVQGKAVTERVDVYAFGAVLYEMLVGRKLVQGQTFDECYSAIVHTPADLSALRSPSFPPGVAALVEKCAAKDPAARFANFGEVRAALGELRDPAPAPAASKPRRNRMHPAIVATAGAALFVLGAGLWWMRHRLDPPPVAVPIVPPEGMVLVPAGDAGAFYIDRTEVSTASYLQFCRERSRPAPEGLEQQNGDLPAVNVTFADAQEYAHWAGKRLPRPDEWTKAARGVNPAHANLPFEGRGGGTEPVGSRPDGASEFGVLNLIGNVWEWVDATGRPSQRQLEEFLRQFRTLRPPLQADDIFAQIRGGSYRYPKPEFLPVERWSELTTDNGYLPVRAGRDDVGFRCAMDPRQ